MKNFILLSFSLCLFLNSSYAQKIRWPYLMNGESFGAGIPAELGKGSAYLYPGDDEAETDKQGNKYFHYQFMPFNAQQVMIMEIDNPGAILKVTIGFKEEGERKITTKDVYTGSPEVIAQDLYIRHITFPTVDNITDVWLYMDFDHAEGMNRIGGVALTDFEEPYIPKVNLPESELFEAELVDLNEDTLRIGLGDLLSPTNPIISTDGKTIYFTSKIKDVNKVIWDPNTTVEEGVNKIFEASVGDDGMIRIVEPSNYNLDDAVDITDANIFVSAHSSLVSLADNDNTMFINTMDPELTVFKVSMTKDKDGYAVYKKKKIKFRKFENKSDYLNDIMSQDGEYYIVSMWKEDDPYEKFERDLYVAKRVKENQYGDFVRMGDDINTIGSDIPCYLSPDNKTFYFASDGHFGFGEKDIYVTHRLDNTWQNWSQPVNLGPVINTYNTENYFTIGPKGEYAYIVKWGADEEGFSDLFRVKILSNDLK